MLPQRIMIVGLPGAGKSTFGNKLAQALQLPCYVIDRYYWKPNWQKYTVPEWMEIHRELIEQPCWIIEGCAIKSSFLERYARADLVIYFKFSRVLCLWRMIKRYFGLRDFTLNDRPDNCPEALPWRLIKYMWDFDSKLMSPLLPEAKKKYPHVSVVILRDDHEVSLLFDKLSRTRNL